MKRLKLLMATLAATMLGAFMVPVLAHATVGGPTCSVPANYPTIQAAVNVPGCTTINVAAGTYTENVTIARALTLNGVRSTVDARTRSGSESVINGGTGAAITITADNVKVDGFTLNGPTSSGSAAIVMQTGNTGETVKDNIFNNPGRAASITTSNTTFSKNLVKNTSTSTDGFQTNSTPVSGLTISDNTFSGANPATYNADITVIEGNSNVVVSGNKSTGDGTLIALFKTNGAQITNNTVVGGGGSSAIYIGGANSNVTVSGNTVSAAGSAVKVANDFGDGANSSVTITNNKLQNSIYGIRVTDGSGSSVAAHQNSLTGNTSFGITNETAGTVNGTCNWWGTSNGPGPVGPGTGDKVSTGVTYQPWLTGSASGPCNGPLLPPPSSKDDCKNNGWKAYNNPSFKNQGKCIDYVNCNSKEVESDGAKYTAYGLVRTATFDMNTADNSGKFEYSDANGDWYKVTVSSVKVNGNDAWFAGVVTKASNPAWIGNWIFAKVENGSPDKIWGSFATETAAKAGVAAMSNPADGPFNITKGNIKIK